jgi:hypothetical protein
MHVAPSDRHDITQILGMLTAVMHHIYMYSYERQALICGSAVASAASHCIQLCCSREQLPVYHMLHWWLVARTQQLTAGCLCLHHLLLLSTIVCL